MLVTVSSQERGAPVRTFARAGSQGGRLLSSVSGQPGEQHQSLQKRTVLLHLQGPSLQDTQLSPEQRLKIQGKMKQKELGEAEECFPLSHFHSTGALALIEHLEQRKHQTGHTVGLDLCTCRREDFGRRIQALPCTLSVPFPAEIWQLSTSSWVPPYLGLFDF